MISGDFRTASPDETRELGRKLSRELSPGDVVAFRGELGSGKTTMIRGIAEGIGVSEDQVCSPTFTLINEYGGDIPVYHIDLYRIETRAELAELGLWEIFSGEAISLVEWADRWEEELPEDSIEIEIHRTAPGERKITITGLKPATDKG